MTARRIIPADYMPRRLSMTQREAMTEWRADQSVIVRWDHESNVTARLTRRPVPVDFASRAPSMTAKALRRHYQTGVRTIARWADESGVRPLAEDRTYRFPDDYLSRRNGMTQRQAAEAFDVHLTIIRRWDVQVGYKPEKPAKPEKPPKPIAPARSSARSSSRRFDPVDRPHVDSSVAGRAADHLRHWGHVYRCAPTGRADPKGTHWRRGSAVLTDAELVQRAERQGFVAEWWKVAA